VMKGSSAGASLQSPHEYERSCETAAQKSNRSKRFSCPTETAIAGLVIAFSVPNQENPRFEQQGRRGFE
jgi:hypothetical protein